VRVVIAKKLLSSIGGSEMFARALDRELRALGHEVTLVGMRPAWHRPGVPGEALAAPPGPVAIRTDGTRFVFIPARGGRIGAAIDGLLPTALVDPHDLRRALAGADLVHSIAREWVGPLERAARDVGAAFVETPLVHPGQPFSGTAAADLARYRRDDAVIALTEWEAGWYRARGVAHVYVTGIGPNLHPLPEVGRDDATVLFVGRRERYKGYHALRTAARLVWAERPDTRFVTIGQRRGTPRSSAVSAIRAGSTAASPRRRRRPRPSRARRSSRCPRITRRSVTRTSRRGAPGYL
jgi:glycosyltransferase involved in cell wall biosynthesis